MRSVYAKIFAWSLVMLGVLTALFFVIGNQIEMRFGTNEVFRNIITLELEQTTQAYKTNGRAGAADVISRLNRVMKWRHYVLGPDGIELSTGVNRSNLIARLNGRWNQPIHTRDGLLIGWREPGNANMLIAETPVSFGLLNLLPYNALILLTVAALSWPLALHFGSPLRSLARTVDRFGQGDLSVRAQSARRDEIGTLARSFDRMAERIETLLTAERRLLQDVSHELQ